MLRGCRSLTPEEQVSGRDVGFTVASEAIGCRVHSAVAVRPISGTHGRALGAAVYQSPHAHSQSPLVPLPVDVIEVRLRVLEDAITHRAVVSSLLVERHVDAHNLTPAHLCLEVELVIASCSRKSAAMKSERNKAGVKRRQTQKSAFETPCRCDV